MALTDRIQSWSTVGLYEASHGPRRLLVGLRTTSLSNDGSYGSPMEPPRLTEYTEPCVISADQLAPAFGKGIFTVEWGSSGRTARPFATELLEGTGTERSCL
jgi:hypothetical protein